MSFELKFLFRKFVNNKAKTKIALADKNNLLGSVLLTHAQRKRERERERERDSELQKHTHFFNIFQDIHNYYISL